MCIKVQIYRNVCRKIFMWKYKRVYKKENIKTCTKCKKCI